MVFLMLKSQKPISVGAYGGIEAPVRGCGECHVGYWNAGGPPLLHWTWSNAGGIQKNVLNAQLAALVAALFFSSAPPLPWTGTGSI